MKDALKTYKAKRDFTITPEPAEGGQPGRGRLAFVIQKHWARRLHYDFRLELDGTMKSWAVPKGPSYDTHDKRMAVHVEDHPISYNEFEGTIPEKQYGAGKVIIWDRGTWEPVDDPRKGYRAGKLVFQLHGHKMHGRWALVRMRGKGEDKEPWLLIKEKDEYVRPADEFSVVDEMPDSVKGLGDAADAEVGPEAPPVQRLPAEFEPELATLVESPPSTPEDWLFEVKYDGYRLLARIVGDDISLHTRNRNDWTHKLGPLRDALAAAGLPDGWYDGEIVVHDAKGRPDFGLLQQAFDGERTKDIVYFLFDAPYLAGEDLRGLPLMERRARLEAVLSGVKGDTLRLSVKLAAPPEAVLAAACQMGLEGVIGKRRNSVYTGRRSRDWIKLKCAQRQEFVIGGYTDPQGSRTGIGSLLLGVYDKDGALHYAGNVGTGFNDKTLRELAEKLKRLGSSENPFSASKAIARKAHWVKPKLVAEVSFGEWTRGGSVRHAVFQGLRKDKEAGEIRREEAAALEEETVQSKLPASLKVSNPDRLVDQASGLKKIDVVRYYALVADPMLEHTRGRPVAMLRAPEGVGAELFFQKHADVSKLRGLKEFPRELDPDHPPMLEVGTTEALLSAAQFNVIEFHTQNAFGRTYEKPNRILFDLDPGSGVEWTQIQEAAQLVHAFLGELGLPCFLKTSGGKGLHVVVPIKPYYDWDTVKAFSKLVVEHMSATLPDRFAFKSGPKNRVGKIFIDYLRNGRGATTVAAWSARARAGLGISVPVGWDELAGLRGGDHWTVATAHTRLDVGNAPWADYASAAVGLAPALKAIGMKAG
ncbi:DNA ligase D [Pseudoduganella violaceinigra]|uniref:DNA ligase D n=1 Tax=Pseudoduganella violaceinigra TaxID=246602 RepID=UPI000413D53E|nr:DNA ligase D [Pseudoduganella violaceinigra]